MDPGDPMDEDTPSSLSAHHPAIPSSSATTATTATTAGKQQQQPAGAAASSSSTLPVSAATPAQEAQAQTVSKRRRGLGIVTANACTECRKKRAKCDGQQPCSRCKGLGVTDCLYEVPVRMSKETLRNELEALKRQQRNSDQVFAALVRPGLWEQVLSRLRNGQTVETISEWLGGVFLPSGGAGAGAPPAVANRAIASSSNATYATSGSGPYSSLGGTVSTVSPGSSHHPSTLRHEADPHSPWGGAFGSQAGSTRSDSHPDLTNWAADVRSRRPEIGTWLENEDGGENQRFRGLDQILTPEIPDMKVPAGAWTKITDDSRLVQHLLALYFCWEYPTFASLSKEHFLKDFQDGRTRFCSSILVNALLALGCRFSSQPSTRANPDDPYTSGDHFFKESLRLLAQEESHHSLTTIQALGIMSIREASCGRDSESWYYAGQSIRLAIEMGLHRINGDGADDDEVAVQSATFWGAFALDHAWSLATGSLPQCSCFPHLPPKPAIINDTEASLWIAYTDDGASLQRSCEQPSNVRSVYKCFCELSELVHQLLYILHSPGKPLLSRDLLNIYMQYLNWYDQIPEVLRLGHNFTPAVLFAHMYYHFAILLLFRPLIKLRIIGSSISPKDVCLQAADAIHGLVRSYSQLYTLRRTPSFVPYFVLTAAIMHLAIGASPSPTPTAITQAGGSSQPESASQSSQQQHSTSEMPPHIREAISRSIDDLAEMAPYHHFAHQALNILRYLAKKLKIEVKIKGEAMNGPASHLSRRGIQPATDSLNFFAPNVSEKDVVSLWGQAPPPAVLGQETRARGVVPTHETGQDIKAISDTLVDNPLFWPFPMQGRPMLPSGDNLREAGFEVL